MDFFLNSGINFTLALQNIGDWIHPIMKVFTFLGTEDFFIIFLILIWAIDYNLSVRLGIMLMLTSSINSFLKMAFHLPRPYWVDNRVKDLGGIEGSFGAPSGHSQAPVSLYGLFASALKSQWGKILVWSAVFLIGISRMILGVHFYLDVLIGWAFGFIILWAYLKYEPAIKNWFSKKEMAEKILAVFGVSMFLLLANFAIRALNADFVMDATWLSNAEAAHPGEALHPFSMATPLSTSATLFGLAVGYFWINKDGNYQPDSNYSKKLLIFIIGLVGVLAIKMGLSAIFPSGENLTGYFFRYLRYSLIGFWIMGLAPWLLLKMKLAKK